MEIVIKRGHDLRLQGGITAAEPPREVQVNRIAICPDDFDGFVPKTEVRVGDKVSVGDALLHDKNDERLKLVSPLCGTVVAVERGARRHIERVIVEASDEKLPPKKFDARKCRSAEKLIELLADAGILAEMRRRPFADMPQVDVMPRDIFVTAFDSAPLAVDRVWTDADTAVLQAGASTLSHLTKGTVYLSKRSDSTLPKLSKIVEVEVRGPHPSGLPGVQAANIAPVNREETIWTLSVETMWRIGRMVLSGIYDPTTFVTVCGSCVSHPYVALTIVGAPIKPLLDGEIESENGNVRIISGNVLTGIKESIDEGYLHFPYRQLTVIPEGDDVDEFMGWASLSPKKMSISPSFPGRFFRKVFNPDARIHGGQRAIIMSGEYDRVVPMGILVEYLVKAILSRNIENMEKLGIYEVAPEDFALAECLDSSKLPLQKIVREGLDYLRKELS